MTRLVSEVSSFLHLCAILPSAEQICGDFFISVNSDFNFFFFNVVVLFSSAKDFFKGKVSDTVV